MTNALLQEAQTLATQDQTVTPSVAREITPAGLTTARFTGYIELGKRKQRDYEGKPRAATEECMLIFELNGKAHRREIEQDGVLKQVTNTKIEQLTIKLGDKGGFKKLFNKMRNGREKIKHMSHMLGEGFLIRIIHNKGTGENANKTYANIKNSEGEWTVAPPIHEDVLNDVTTVIECPAATEPLRLLLWDNPSKMQWDSLFIDGSYKRKDKDGKEQEFSKNWIQNGVVSKAVNFDGSALEAMLLANGGVNFDRDLADEPEDDGHADLTDLVEPDAPAAPVAAPPAAKAADLVFPAFTAAKKAPTAAQAQSADDMLAQLGLA